jgi:hypothetical protein
MMALVDVNLVKYQININKIKVTYKSSFGGAGAI